ncbi:SCO2322 family protein [Streptomyces sp. G-G2]|uniref:SCO2322 family protein n=1 Tax=Streptomyces sp. G-G2 TaxID=3046201 RepID=UPI0024B980CA|nr:SCO2322 family protein [Streptomyces sp. G-G2]MDJ0385890.1 SCO2322 family protein [Streptomyces sp. G-G2]
MALTVLGAAPALAAGYRYWSFWDGTNGSWTYATQGASQVRPKDGSVQGFRFGVGQDAADDSVKPRAGADFGAVCSGTAAVEGRKRVALVIDFGVPADGPSGETPPRDTPRTACAVVAPDATAADALAEVAKPLRYNSAALLCAISGYPKQGCGDQVAPAEPKPSAAASTSASAASSSADGSGGGPSVGLLAGIAAVIALAAAAFWQSRPRAR